ncbi:hypothetical protein [Psychrobacter lutiphocae]|uniref:hypothetical protein n=1 Tax=Psychrobacter lutiphocae TaxID=540500 RepID=UPI00036F6490|nr:hypothetical protein [Psychrobacter lutiphocae]
MKSQKGNIAVEYLLATLVVIAIVFGIQVGDKNLWSMMHEAFQTRHTNYSKSISHLDDVDALTDTERK